MKTTINIILFCLIVASTNVFAGSPNKEKASNDKNNEPSWRALDNMVSFTTVTKDSKTYLTWNIEQEQTDCVYAVEKSIDGTDFYIVGLKQGFASNLPVRIMYSWTDKKTEKCNYCLEYRIKRISDAGEIAYSNTIEIFVTEMGDAYAASE